MCAMSTQAVVIAGIRNNARLRPHFTGVGFWVHDLGFLLGADGQSYHFCRDVGCRRGSAKPIVIGGQRGHWRTTGWTSLPANAMSVPIMEPTNRPLADWIADFDASDAEYDAGDLIRGETIIAEVESALDQLEAKLTKSRRREAIANR